MGRRRNELLIVGVAVAMAAAGLARASDASAGGQHCPWVRSRVPIVERVRQVMARMNTPEKLKLVHGTLTGLVTTTGPVYAGDTAAIPSLCIPPLHLQDGPAGVGDEFTRVTQLPAPVALAATWDRRLAYRYGAVVGAEQQGKGANVDLGPTVNIVRDPRWGRAFEAYGEDPYLTSAVAVAYIEGVQAQGVMSQVKHLAAYAQETGRDGPTSDAIVSERALEEIYLPPFQEAVQRAHVASVMCAYNQVNHTPACQNGFLLHQVLDGQFGFGGFVTSDWFATQSAAPSADAGLDMQMPDGCFFSKGLSRAMADRAVPRRALDTMVRRILTEMFRFHLIGARRSGRPGDSVSTPAHVALGRQVAQASTVLLKNGHGLLPLSRRSRSSIAVIGADGGAGAYTAGGGSAHVIARHDITPYRGIVALAGRHVKVTYNDGSQPSAAAQAARAASVAVVFADLPESESQDLPSINLPPSENTLISDVAAANPRTIVVLNTGSAVTMPWLHSVRAVLEAWYPGQEDGRAIASVLFGDVDPGGKLPVTFPASLSQVPAFSPTRWPGAGQQDFSEGIFVGYRYYQAHHETPLFPFGYGLSYTRFTFSKPRVSGRGGRFAVSVTARNTGRRSGSDVVQLYVGDPSADGEPPRQLEGFQRVTLGPGHSARVVLDLTPRDLSVWLGRWVARRGRYQLYIGDSSVHLPIRRYVSLTRKITTGRPLASPPRIHPDSPTLATRCYKDTFAPDVAALLTFEGDAQAIKTNLESLP
jgi:beta-glucosidase